MAVPGRPELTHIIHKLPAPSTRMTPYQRFRLIAILEIARAIPVGGNLLETLDLTSSEYSRNESL
jgi:hypothetical protein